jgi:hypothetical protein
MLQTYGASCIPWYYPTVDGDIEFCDPWQTNAFFYFMFDDIPDDACSKCLPDCRDRFYETPFRPKTIRINYHPQISDKFLPKDNRYV